jgi:tetratricopeptide (TPR) repeat protein
MDRELFDRWKNGRLLKMSEINHAFRGPDVMFAYFQGGLIADLIAKDWGFEAVTAMLRRFAEDVPTERVVEEVLKVPLADFDRRLEAHVATLVGGYRMVPRWDEESRKALEARTKEAPDDAGAWTRLAWAYLQRGATIDAGAALARAKALAPDAPDAILLEGELALRADRRDTAKTHFERFLAAGGDDVGARTALARIALEERRSQDAVTHFEAAKRCFPRQTGRGSPYLELARLHEGAGRMEDAVRELEAYAAIAQEDYDVRRKLAGWYVSQRDDEALMRVSDEMIEISPFGAPKGKPPDLLLHRRYAEALVRAGRKPEAVREWRVQTLLLDMLPEEARAKAGAVDARLALGELLLELGSPEEALEQALAALALDPESGAAKILKARAQGGGNPR